MNFEQVIDQFKGDYRFLSNFWMLTVPIQFRGIKYPSVEHFYVAQKTIDTDFQQQIAEVPTSGKVKRVGQQLELREDWETIKVAVMEEGVQQKFLNNPKLQDKLNDTGDLLLIEGNHWHDQFWGNCTCEKHDDTPGKNALGILLMRTRLTCFTKD